MSRAQPNELGELGNISDAGEVFAQIENTLRLFTPEHDLARIEASFDLLQRAFGGELPGYAPLKTPYHNSSHTFEVVLCAARMAHGLHLSGRTLDALHLDAMLMGALMHDVGYLMTTEEATGTGSGAQYTATHVARSVEFVRARLAGFVELPRSLSEAIIKVVQVTDHRQHPDWVSFDNDQQKLAAHATATADLVGQMANREYLERLLLLYIEFQEAKIPGFGNIHELLEKTADFYRVTRLRIDQHLGGLEVNLQAHFCVARGEDRNIYSELIGKNMAYLGKVVSEARGTRLRMLRRGGIVERSLDKLAELEKG